MLKYFYTLSVLLLIEMTMVSCQRTTHQVRNRSQNHFYRSLIRQLNGHFSNTPPQGTTHQVDKRSQRVLRSIMKNASIDDLELIARNRALKSKIESEINKNYSAHHPFKIDGSDPKNIKFLECFEIQHIRYLVSGLKDSNVVRLLQLPYIRSFVIVGLVGYYNRLDLSNGNITDDRVALLLSKLPEATKKSIDQLNLSGNLLTRIKGLDQFPNLKFLNLANNRLESVEGLSNFPRLCELSLANNRLESVEGLSNFSGLYKLNLAGNCLTSVKGLSSLPWLYTLNLANNRFESIEGLVESIEGRPNFPMLGSLSLANNFLKSVKGLSNFPMLVSLTLANNCLESIEGLSNFPMLISLNLANNHLTSVEGLSKFPMLYDLDLVNNCLREEELNKLPSRFRLRLHPLDKDLQNAPR